MAQYNGFICDNPECGKIIDPEDRIKVTVRYEGRTVSGEYSLDKCPGCVGEPPKPLKPLRRRRSKKALADTLVEAVSNDS